MKKIVIVAETGADIPLEIVEKYELNIIPMYVNFDDETRKDGSFPVSMIYDYHVKTGKLPQTSAVNPENYRLLFKQLHNEHPEKEILHLSYSAVTTATYSNALIASENLPYVTHIDTKGVSGGQAAIVIRTARYLEEHPYVCMNQLVEMIEGWIGKLRMKFFSGDLGYLRAGGRVSNAAYLGATILSIKPLIEIHDGNLVSTRNYRGSMSKVSKRLIMEFFENEKMDLADIYLLYSEGLDDDVHTQNENLIKEYGVSQTQWIKTGGVITTHSGPGAFGIVGFAL